MISCPKCGHNVQTPIKTWPIPTRKPLEEGQEAKLAGIFECPNCKARFRAAVEPQKKAQETVSIKDMVGRIVGIKEELTLTLTNLREKIRKLETEKSGLMMEIENLRKVAESKASALESEVSMLRKDVQSFKDLLGYEKGK